MTFKRVLAVSDLHCGNRVGLTPSDLDPPPMVEEDMKWGIQREEQWNWFKTNVGKLRDEHQIDLLLILGDCVDGTSPKAAGRDIIWNQAEDQITMATQVIESIKAKKIAMVYGTTYHVQNTEKVIASHVGADIDAHLYPNVDGVQFDIKHKVGTSKMPYGQHTPLSRAVIWNQLHAGLVEDQPDADIVLRGHAHYHIGASGVGKGKIWHAWTMPALEGPGSEFGARECDGIVHYGFMHFDVFEDGTWTHQPHLLIAESTKAQPIYY